MSDDKRKKILVVDDEPSITDLVAAILEDSGFYVSQAKDGREGLRQIDSLKYDLVITDITMPDMEGIELIREIRKRDKDIPIVVMSGNLIGTQFFQTARLFGAKETLMKPFTAGQLLETVGKVLGLQ